MPALLELGDQLAQRVLAGPLAERDRLVLGHRRRGADEVRLVAGDEHDPRARRRAAAAPPQHAHLRVAVELQRVVLGHAGLHAAGGVEHEDVESAPLLLGPASNIAATDSASVRSAPDRDGRSAGRLIAATSFGARRLACGS